MDLIESSAKGLGDRIGGLRKQLDLRQQDVAARAGVSRATVREVEHGSLTASLLSYLKVLQALGALQDIEHIARPAAQPIDVHRPRARVRPRFGRGTPQPPARAVPAQADIRVDEYPQLAQLAWNRRGQTLTAEEALALYESNWRFVDPDSLSPRERALIDRLVRDHGHGVLNVV